MAYSANNSSSTISVTNLGIVPNGAIDNKTALQNAINSQVPNGPTTFFFPKGTYYFNGTVNVTGQDISFVGEEGSRIIAAVDESAKKFNVSGAKRIKFANLTFDANRTGTAHVSNQNGFISTINVEDIVIENCNFYNTRNSLIYLGGGTKLAKVLNNYFTGHFCGIYGYINSGEANSEKFIISNNSFGSSWPGNTNESACIKLQSSSYAYSIGHTVDSNSINSEVQMGIEFWNNGRDGIVSNNNITKTAWGISLDGQRNVSVVGNTIKGVSYMGIECASVCKNITIGNNIVNGYTGNLETESRESDYGISSSNTTCELIIYNGNIVEGCGYGFNIQNTIDTVIANNIIRDNTINLNYQGGRRSQIFGNLFDSGKNGTAYHIFFDAASWSLSGFHVSNNKFRGETTNQSIFYYNNSTSNKIYDVCLENNVTDQSTYGGYGSFVAGQLTPTNYIYRNNFGPSGAGAHNSIVDASDSTQPYQTTDIENGFSYYGSFDWTIPASGVTGNGVWLCVWSGGYGMQNNVRIEANNNFNQEGNHYNAIEIWATMSPYDSFYGADSLYASPFYSVNLYPYIERVKTARYSTPHNAIWIKLRPIGTGAAGQTFNFKYSKYNALSTPYATYTEPPDVTNNANLYLSSNLSLNALPKFSNGISVGNATAFYSPSSGKYDFVGALNSPMIFNKGNLDVSFGLKTGLAVIYYTGLYDGWNPSSKTEMDGMFRTGVRFVSGGFVPNINGYSSNQNNYAAEFVGYFYASGDGNYSFGVNSDDAGDIHIDGNLAAYWYGGHGSGTGPGGTQNTLYLSQGMHRFWGRFQDGIGSDIFQTYVKGPTDSSFYVIPQSLLFSSPNDYVFKSQRAGEISFWTNTYHGAGELVNYKTITANYTLLPTDNRVYCNNSTNITLTFPDATTNDGQLVKVKLVNNGSVTLTGTYRQTFDGLPSIVQSGRYFAFECHATGAAWNLW